MEWQPELLASPDFSFGQKIAIITFLDLAFWSVPLLLAWHIAAAN